MVLQVLAPFIYVTLKKSRVFSIGVLLILSISNFLPVETNFGFKPISLIYFAIGSYIGIHHKEFYKIIRSKRHIIWVTYMIFIIIDWVLVSSKNLGFQLPLNFQAAYIHSFCAILGMPAIILFGARLVRIERLSGQLKSLASSGMLVFCMHSLINSKITALFLLFSGKHVVSSLEALIFYFLTISLTILICVSCHIVIDRKKHLATVLEGKL